MKSSRLGNFRIFNFKFLILNSNGVGFTLLEIMISLAIIGGLLVTLIYTLNYHLSIVGRHETITIASLLAREKIIEGEKSLESKKGVFPEPYPDYSYETTISESSFPGISELSVVVKRDKEKVRFSELVQSAK